MNMWSISYTAEAIKAMTRLDHGTASRIRRKLTALAKNPHAPNNNVKKLSGVDGYRFRVGDWRVVYVLREQVLTVLVLRIGHRGEVYR